jgi:hypothetical protein
MNNYSITSLARASTEFSLPSTPQPSPAGSNCRGSFQLDAGNLDDFPHELGGRVDLVFASDGVCCNIEIPLEPN